MIEWRQGDAMRKDLDFLPERKQKELHRIVSILFEELEDKLKTSTSPKRKNGRILKVILFGTHARGDWVEDPKGGYFSDFDLLVILNNKDLTDETAYWAGARDRIYYDQSIKTPVNMIYHSLTEVNRNIKDGLYFFTDIRKEGVIVYELIEQSTTRKSRHYLARPRELDPKKTYDLAKEYFDEWQAATRDFLDFARFGIEKRKLKRSAFQLHQAAESAYTLYLLTRTLYRHKKHDLHKLRNMTEDREPSLRKVWPRGRKPYDRYFDLLNRAYVEARYSRHYRTTKEILEWQADHIEKLLTEIELVCLRWLAHLEAEAKKASSDAE